MTEQNRHQQILKSGYAVSFLAPVLILVIVLICNGVFPFGEECFLRTDMYHQYAPFFSEFREKLQNGGSLFYSWNIGLGVNFTALYAYYLASPLNWLIVLCPEAYVIEFMMGMVVLKIGLCGLSMCVYLRKHFRTDSFGAALFAVFYALSGYLAAYYWNLMWLDCILLFPLIAYGLECLVQEKRGLLYTASLGLSILSNYYISIMICIFMVLYFVCLNILHRPESIAAFFGRFLRFALWSLLAGGLAAVLLLPEIAALGQTASSDVNFPKSFTEYFSVIDMLARHLPGVETEQALDHWPNIYCGAAVYLFFFLYLFSERISRREKAVSLVLLLFFLMSFSVNVLNFIWHGFHYPNSLPARQSFIYIFLVLTLCFRAYLCRREFRAKEIGRALFLSIVFVLLCQKLVTAKHFHFAVYYAGILLLSVYAALLYAARKRSLRGSTAALLALSVVMMEAAANTAITSVTTTSRTAYTADNEDVRALVDTLTPASGFFRVEKITRKSKNDGAWLNFPSVSLFSSMANADCTAFFKALGCEASTNAYSITGSTPFVNMLFSVKYAVYNQAQTDGEEKFFLESTGDSYLYENRLSLPLGFMMPEEMKSGWVQDLDNPALVQDALCDLLGTEAVLQPNAELPSESGADLAVTIGADGEYYAFVTNPQVKSVEVRWPDREKTFENVNRGYLLELGTCKKGDLISMKSLTANQDMQAQIYRFDYAALRQVYNRLSAYPLDLGVWEDDFLSGSVKVEAEALGCENGEAVMFLSIPYDEGWEILIDGQPARPLKLFDTFLGVSVPDGVHELTLRFVPQGIKAGAAISGVSLLILLLLAAFARRRRRREEMLWEEEDFFSGNEVCEEDADDAKLLQDPAEEDAFLDATGEDAEESAAEAEPEAKSRAYAGKTVEEITEENAEEAEDEITDEEFRAMFFRDPKEALLSRLSALSDAEPESDSGNEQESPDAASGKKCRALSGKSAEVIPETAFWEGSGANAETSFPEDDELFRLIELLEGKTGETK